MKKKRQILRNLIFFMLCAVLMAGTAVSLSASTYERWDTVAEEEREEYQATKGLLREAAVSEKAWQKINGVCYNGSGVKIPGAITRGIDVSEWQETINWKQVKSAGIDFAFVRVAYGLNYLDKQYDANMKNAAAAGVPVGVYIYSTATTTAGALKEAQLVISKLKGYKVSYPVVFDLEYSPMGELSKLKVAKLALTFCNEIKKAGYYPMVYCNTSWYDEKVNWSTLKGVDVWIARYGDKIQAPSGSAYNYTIWQATDGDGGGVLNSTRGLVAGIPAGDNVDINFGFVDYTKIITPRTAPAASYTPSAKPDITSLTAVTPTPTPEVPETLTDADVSLKNPYRSYSGKALKNTVTVEKDGKVLTKGTDYKVSYKNNIEIGTATVTIKGKGNYSGTVTKTYQIVPRKGSIYTVGKLRYKITKTGITGGTVTAIAPVRTTYTTVRVPANVKIEGYTYKVTAVGVRAFKGNTKLKTVTIGKNVSIIRAQAFYGCKALTSLKINSKVLTKAGANSLKGINAKAVITVPEAKLTAYTALLKGKGQGKNVKVTK